MVGAGLGGIGIGFGVELLRTADCLLHTRTQCLSASFHNLNFLPPTAYY